MVEARSLVTRALDGVNEHAMTSSHLAFAHQCAALALAASASVLHGDTSNLRALADAAEHELVERDYRDTLLGGIGDLVALSVAKDPAVRRLAKSSDRWVRRAVASALRTDEPAARALLLTMVSDPSSHVRNAARAALGEGAVPWWTGIFSRDPTEALSDDDAAALAPTFAAIAAALGPAPKGKRRPAIADDEVNRLSRALPTELALDLGRQQGRDEGQVHRLSPWVLAAVRREGGEVMLADILTLQARADGYSFDGVTSAAKKLAPAARLRFALLAIRLRAYDAHATASAIATMAVSLLRPGDRDLVAAELLEIYGNDDEAFDEICGSFKDYFSAGGHCPAALVDWAFALLDKDEEENRRLTEIFAKALLEKAPKDRTRALALRLLERDSASRREWALLELLGRLHDPSLDGPKAARVRALYEEPSLRRLFLNQSKLLDRAVVYARADLRNHRLDYEEARHVAFAIVRQQKKKRSGSDERPYVLPARELEAYLALRANFRFEGKSWHLRDFAIIGHSTELGKAHLAAAVAAVRAGDDEAAAALGVQLMASPNAAFLEVGMEMAGFYAESGLPPLLRMGIEHAHEELGLTLDEPLPRRDDDTM